MRTKSRLTLTHLMKQKRNSKMRHLKNDFQNTSQQYQHDELDSRDTGPLKA